MTAEPETAAVDLAGTDAGEERPDVLVHPVKSGYVADVWPHAEPLIRAAVAEGYGEENVSDVLEKLAARQYQLWLILVDNQIAAAVITTIVVMPRLKACRIIYLGGADAKVWISALDETLSDWAAQLDCDVLQPWGRKGWARIIKQFGAKPVATIFQKRLR